MIKFYVLENPSLKIVKIISKIVKITNIKMHVSQKSTKYFQDIVFIQSSTPMIRWGKNIGYTKLNFSDLIKIILKYKI